MESWQTLRIAASTLVEKRRKQRGCPTLGDDADRALLAALAALPPDGARAARESGAELGAHVYSRCAVEDTLARNVGALTRTLQDSGFGTLQLEASFHRTATLRFAPSSILESADAQVRDSFLEGIVEGFFSEALNCAARACANGGGAVAVELGDGRDVNRRGSAA